MSRFLLVRKATISIICLQWSTTSCKRFLINPNSLQENQSPQANSQVVLAHTPPLPTTCPLKLVRLFLPDAVVYTLERQQAVCIPSKLSFYPQSGLVWWLQWAFTFRKFIRELRKTMSLCRKIEERDKRGERRGGKKVSCVCLCVWMCICIWLYIYITYMYAYLYDDHCAKEQQLLCRSI